MSSNELDSGGGGGSSRSLSDLAGKYVKNGTIRWAALIRDSVGTVVLAYVFWLADVVMFVLGGIRSAVDRLGDWITELVFAITTAPAAGLERVFAETFPLLDALGIFALPVAVVIVLTVLYVADRVYTSVTEAILS